MPRDRLAIRMRRNSGPAQPAQSTSQALPVQSLEDQNTEKAIAQVPACRGKILCKLYRGHVASLDLSIVRSPAGSPTQLQSSSSRRRVISLPLPRESVAEALHAS